MTLPSLTPPTKQNSRLIRLIWIAEEIQTVGGDLEASFKQSLLHNYEEVIAESSLVSHHPLVFI